MMAEITKYFLVKQNEKLWFMLIMEWHNKVSVGVSLKSVSKVGHDQEAEKVVRKKQHSKQLNHPWLVSMEDETMICF